MISNTPDIHTLCQHYLTILYQNIQRNRAHEDQITHTYGEILYPGIKKLLSKIKISDQDVFVDLGSGLGKIILQVFLLTPVKEAYGIEILPALHNQALAVAEKFQHELSEFFVPDRKLTFCQGDFLETSLNHATIAIICSQCYSQPMLLALAKKIDATPNIHTVLTLRPMTFNHLQLKNVVRIECSWDTALCYIYHPQKQLIPAMPAAP